MSVSVHTRAHYMLFGLAMVVLVSACTPYPMYNNGGEAPDRHATQGDTDQSDEPNAEAGGVYAAAADERNRSDEVMPSAIEPRVFERVVDSYIGIPYAAGGDGKSGIDCSNLVSAVYRDYAGKRLPTSTRSQYRLPLQIAQDDLQVGDLVFFSLQGGHLPDHVGLYLGDGRFAHASESRGVIYSSVGIPYFRDAYRGARRVM